MTQSPRARAGVLALLAAVGALGVIASGCVGSSGEGVAQVDTTTTTTTTQGSPSPSGLGDPAAYAACMRRNGVQQFPDPDANGRIRVDKDDVQRSPRYRAAANACKGLLPSPRPSGQQLAEALRRGVQYAACIRAHGVPDFPDPVANAQGNGLDPGGHVDEDSPRFRAAARACIELGRGMKNALVGP